MALKRVEVSGPNFKAVDSKRQGIVTRRAKAAVREGSEAVRRNIKADVAAKAKYPTGAAGGFRATLEVDVPKVTGDTITGGVTAAHRYAHSIERGRGPVALKPGPTKGPGRKKRALTINTGRRGSRGSQVLRGSADSAKPTRYVEQGAKRSDQELRMIENKWARAIADDLRGPVR